MNSPFKMRVLLVDDNEPMLETLLLLVQLEKPDWEVKIASDHASGLKAALVFRPHVICSNIGRYIKSGLEFAKSIREDPLLKNAFLIAITGWGDIATRKEMEAAGFDVQLTKPVSYDEFAQQIRAFARARSLRGLK